jgi:hypothetical protein
VSPVKYELGFYIPEDDILNTVCLHIGRVDSYSERVSRICYVEAYRKQIYSDLQRKVTETT